MLLFSQNNYLHNNFYYLFGMGLTGSSCCCRESYSRLAGYHGTVHPFRWRLETEYVTGIMWFIPFSGTAECARDTGMLWEMPCQRIFLHPCAVGEASASSGCWTTQQCGPERNLSDCNIAHCPRWVGAPLCFLMESSFLPSDN